MALRLTLTVGLLGWWLLGIPIYNRTAMGTLGPLTTLFAVGFLLLLVACGPVRRVLLAAGGAGGAAGTQHGWRVALRIWGVVVLLMALAAWLVSLVFVDWFDTGISSGAVWLYAAWLVALATPIVLPVLVGALRRQAELPATLPPLPRREAVRVLLVLLSPALAMLLLRVVPHPPPWSVRAPPPSSAGILYLGCFAWAWPALLPVAYGLDRLDGSRGSLRARAVVGCALLALAAAVCVGPALLWKAHTATRPAALTVAGPWAGFADSLRGLQPFVSTDGATGASVALPVDGLLAGASALLLVLAALVGWRLARLGSQHAGRALDTEGARAVRGVRTTSLLALGATQILFTLLFSQRIGPEAAPWAAVLGALVAAGLEHRADRRRAPTWWPPRDAPTRRPGTHSLPAPCSG